MSLSKQKTSAEKPILLASKARTHEECRLVICALCHQKKKGCVGVTEVTEKQIKNHVYPSYDRQVSSFPGGLCSPCSQALRHAKTGHITKQQKQKWDNLKWQDLATPSRTSPCSCAMCCLAKYTFSNVMKKPMVDITNKPLQPEKKPEIKKMCTTCLKEVGRGIPHPCGHQERKKEMARLVTESPSKVLEQV